MEEKSYKTGIVKIAPKNVREFNDMYTIGLQLQGSDVWFNFQAKEEAPLNELIKQLKKGQEIKFLVGSKNVCSDLTILKEVEKDIKKDNSIVNISGKDFMTYEGLLNKAHEKGKFDMIITESWVSEDMKMAWCKVRLTCVKQTFDGFGSSTPDNTGIMTQTHPVEMAHTRAKGRALRDFLNIGQVMAEELKADEETA